MNNNWIYVDKNEVNTLPAEDVWVWDEELKEAVIFLKEDYIPVGKYSWYMLLERPLGPEAPEAYFNVGDTVTIVDDLRYSNHGEQCVIDSYIHYTLIEPSEIGYRLKGQEGIYLNNDIKEFKQK